MVRSGEEGEDLVGGVRKGRGKALYLPFKAFCDPPAAKNLILVSD